MLAYIIIASAICLLLLAIMFVRNISSIIKTIAPENRQLDVDLPWLIFIPFIGQIILFYVVIKLNQSLKKEFIRLDINYNPEVPALYFGVLASILSLPAIVLENDLVNSLALLSVGCLMLYWISLSKLQQLMLANNFRKSAI